MSRISYRSFVITLTTFALAAIVGGFYWGDGYIFGVVNAANQENLAAGSSLLSTIVTTTPLNAITSFDAAIISAHVTGLPPLPTNEHKCAADVTNNGNISSNDAA